MTPIQKARTRLLLRSPFFGTMLMTTPLIETREVPTAATDMKSIYYNPDFFDTLTVDEVLFVLAHEVMHIALMHGLRRGGRNRYLWNVAGDYAINWTLSVNGMTMPACGLFDKRFAGMSADAIYNDLEKNPPPSNDGKPLAGDLMETPLGEKAQVEAEVRSKVAQAVTAARLAGQMPADMERLLGNVLDPQVPWQETLRHFMSLRARTSATWNRRNRRFPDVVLPSRSGVAMGRIGVVIDASGSISGAIMDALISEVVAIGTDVGAKEVHVKFADVRTVHEQRFQMGDPIKLEPKGGGGTDMRVPLAEFDAEDTPPAVVVLLTDGYTPWPAAEPRYPLIVCCTTDASIPVGSEVRINA
jgi:predicted metal-dependent peptidase